MNLSTHARAALLAVLTTCAPVALAAAPSSTYAATAASSLPSTVMVRAVDASAGGDVFAATQQGVYRLSGGIWTLLPTAGLGSLDVRDVLATGGFVFAATEGGGIARWNGAAWTTVNASLRFARSLTEHAGILYATGDEASATIGGTSSVWRSVDGGATWMRTGLISMSALEPWDITFAEGTSTMYVATRKGLWRSDDFGMSFTVTSFSDNNDDAYAVFASGTTVLVGTRDGMRRSTDGGATFGPLYSAGPGRDRNIYYFGYDSGTGRLFLPNNGTRGLLVSSDFGMTFAPVGSGCSTSVEIDRAIVEPVTGRVFLVGRNGGMTSCALALATDASSDRPGADALGLDVAGANPFRGATAVRLTLATTSAVRVHVYDVLGRTVETLAEGTYAEGAYTLPVRTTAAGVYLVRATSGTATQSVRLIAR